MRDADFDVSGVRDAMAVATPVYQLFGKPDHLAAYYPDSGHAFPADARNVAYEFFDLHLKQPLEFEPLRISDSGGVLALRPDDRSPRLIVPVSYP